MVEGNKNLDFLDLAVVILRKDDSLESKHPIQRNPGIVIENSQIG